MKTKEKTEKRDEILTEERVNRIIETISKAAKEKETEGSGIDFEKTKEIVKNFEGTSVQTACTVMMSVMTALPATAIAIILDMGRKVLKTKTIEALVNALGECE